MATMSRTTSREDGSSNHRSQNRSTEGDTQDRPADMPGTPSPTNPTKPGPSLASTGLVPSHSLLSAPQNAAAPSRKSRFADAGTTGTNVGRASISMPPPTTKPSSIYKPSAVRRPSAMQNATIMKEADTSLDGTAEERAIGDTNGLEELEKTTSLPGTQIGSASDPHSPAGLSDTALKPNSNKPGDRLSFSSLYSLGSAICGGATGLSSAPQSTASSTAGSIKSVLSEQPAPTPTPLSPSLGAAADREAASIATTATDPVSVTANSQPLHQGSRSPWITWVSLSIDGFG